MRILLLSRYGRLGSTSRVRFYQYLPYLRTQELEIDVSPLLGDDYIRRLYKPERQSIRFLMAAYFRRIRALATSRNYDLVWLEKEFLPWLPAWFSPISTPYVAEYDDATFHRYDLHPNALVRGLLGGKIDSIMRRASLVIAGNDYLAARALAAGSQRVVILPSVVDLDRYTPAEYSPRSGFRIGWIGAPVTADYLTQIEPALKSVLSTGDGAELVLVGAEGPLVGRLPLEFRRWTEDTEVQEIQQFDVGIMPLPDEPFERGKCGYKLIQYLACGVPVVATPIGVNTEIVEHGVNGFLANTNEEWETALTSLRKDPALRKSMGLAGRKIVEESYSLQITAPRVLELLQSAAKSAVG